MVVDLFRSFFSSLPPFPRKKVLVLEGGGMRGIFLTGVLQAFTDRGYFPWKLIIGSSAGAMTGVAYAAGQIYIARDAFFKELLTGQFIRLSNFLRPEKDILNLDWMVETILKGDEPLDFRRLRKSCPVLITATRCNRDHMPRSIYLNSKDTDVLTALKASAAIPVLYRNFVRCGEHMCLDGALLDPIPYRKALSMGYRDRDILVVVTHQKGYRKKQESFWIKTLYENYFREPGFENLVKILDNRYLAYNRLLEELETGHPDIDVIYPPDDFRVDRLTRDKEKILEGFEQGVAAARQFLYREKTAAENLPGNDEGMVRPDTSSIP